MYADIIQINQIFKNENNSKYYLSLISQLLLINFPYLEKVYFKNFYEYFRENFLLNKLIIDMVLLEITPWLS